MIRTGLALALLVPVPVAAQTAYDCLIEPARTVTVTTPEGGLLAEVPVSRGSTVTAGDVVARLDNSVEETTVAVLAERAGSDAEVGAQLARLALSRSQRDRLQTLVDRQIGAAGELEHGALWHVPGGWAMREVLGDAMAIVPSTKKVGGPGSRLDVPVTHVNASYVRSHFDAMEVGLNDAPRANELALILVMTTGPRIHARVGGLRAEDIEGKDGLR